MKLLKCVILFLFVSHFLYAPSLPHKAKEFLVKKFSKKKQNSLPVKLSAKPIRRKQSRGDSIRLESLRELQKATKTKKPEKKQQVYDRVRVRSMAILHNQLQETGYSPTVLAESEKTITLIRRANRYQKKQGFDLTPRSPFEFRMIKKDFETVRTDCLERAQACLDEGDIAGASRFMRILSEVTTEHFEIIGFENYTCRQDESDIHKAIRNARS